MKKIKIAIIGLSIATVLIIMVILLLLKEEYAINEYYGKIDLTYIKQKLGNNEYYLFEDNKQKYILYKKEEQVQSPSMVEIKSIKIIDKNYNPENKLVLNVDVKTNIIYKTIPQGMFIDGYHTDSRYFILKVKDNCSGLIVNGKEYSKFNGAIVWDEEKRGYVNSEGNLTIPMEYNIISEFANYYYDQTIKDRHYIDYSQYLQIYKNNIGYGIASKDGKILVDCQYDSIINYEKNSFIVNTKDNKFGIIDINGNLLKGFVDGHIYIGRYGNGSVFDDYTFLSLNGYKGIIDSDFNIVLKPQYDNIDFEKLRFHNESGEYKEEYFDGIWYEENYFIVEKNGKRAIVDYEENIKMDFQEISYYDLNSQYKKYVKQSLKK